MTKILSKLIGLMKLIEAYIQVSGDSMLKIVPFNNVNLSHDKVSYASNF